MQFNIRTQHLQLRQNLRKHIERRIRFALERFGTQIRRVMVYLADLNGPRGGISKQCRILVRLAPFGQVYVEGTAGDLGAVVDGTADRVEQSVRRKLKHHRDRKVSRASWARLRGSTFD